VVVGEFVVCVVVVGVGVVSTFVGFIVAFVCVGVFVDCLVVSKVVVLGGALVVSVVSVVVDSIVVGLFVKVLVLRIEQSFPDHPVLHTQ